MLFLDYTPDLNETEKDIFRYISRNIEKVCYMTIRELADELHMSQSSIWRFCQKFDCQGYSDFKFSLKQYYERHKESGHKIDVDESTLINFLKRTTEEEIEEKISVAASLLADKEFVIFLGEGTSRIIAEYGAIYFSSMYNLSLSISHPLLHPISKVSSLTAKKVCVIALSVSGQTDKVINNLNYFSELGASIISITNSEKNPIADISDVNIPYYISIEKNQTADITSQVPALFLIEKLAKTVSNENQ